MEAESAKRIIEKNLQYDEVKRLLVKLVRHESPQTEKLEAEPQVLALIRDVIKPDLEQAGLHPSVDGMGNLILRLNGRGRGDRLMLVGYAMNAAPSTMQNPYSGDIVDGSPYKLDGECVWGRGACEQKGSLAAMMAAMRFVGANKVELPADLYFVVSTAGETGRHDSLAHVLDHGNVEADWCIIDGPAGNSIGQQRTGRRARHRARQAGAQQPALGRDQRHRGRDESFGKTEALNALSGRKSSSGVGQGQLDAQRHRELSQGHPHDPKRVPYHVRSAASPRRRSKKGHSADAGRHRANRAIRN